MMSAMCEGDFLFLSFEFELCEQTQEKTNEKGRHKKTSTDGVTESRIASSSIKVKKRSKTASVASDD